ncbi:serine hydrolase domain-containing protein [Brevibacillus reuszeri]|uniref:serine hydrolase domain-containing protein n=1 Tax=Brevibacillus reuszeri TaxID=54915 RepID=UPI00289A3B3B|nr:serine hydrolase domain-containing protein [Brevibacillus reuszeri]
MERQSNSLEQQFIQLDELFTTLADKKKFNGNIMVLDKGVPLYTGSFGYAQLASSTMLNTDSVFELASVSKAFTAMGIMILQEQGKISYEDTIETFLPDFPYAGISVHHLLTHTSGLPDYMALFEQHWDRSKIAANQDVLEQLKLNKPDVHFRPNEKYEYSNTGYVLLALIIEQVSGTSFADFMEQRIFYPLDMEKTRVYNRRYSQESIDNYAYGYVFAHHLGKYCLPDELADHDFVIYLDGIQGDGVVNSTLEDLRKWDRALYTEKLVSKETLEKAFSPVLLADHQPSDYGYGWRIRNDSGVGKVVCHGGGWPGYQTWLGRYLDHDKTFIYLSNMEQDGERTQANIEAVENILFDRPYRIPE